MAIVLPDGVLGGIKMGYVANKKRACRVGDIVVNRTGTPGTAVIGPDDMDGIMPCGFVFVLRLRKGYDPCYVASFLNGRYGKLQMERLSFGSILEHITKDDLLSVLIAEPPDAERAARIAAHQKKATELQIEARVNLARIGSELASVLGRK